VEKEVKVWHPQYGEISIEKATELLKASKPSKKRRRFKLNPDLGEHLISELIKFIIEEGGKIPYCELQDMTENLVHSLSRPSDNLTFHSLMRSMFTLGRLINDNRWFNTVTKLQLFEKARFSDKVSYLAVRECEVFTALVIKDMQRESILYNQSLRRNV